MFFFTLLVQQNMNLVPEKLYAQMADTGSCIQTVLVSFVYPLLIQSSSDVSLQHYRCRFVLVLNPSLLWYIKLTQQYIGDLLLTYSICMNTR